jgi:hypothetical protein
LTDVSFSDRYYRALFLNGERSPALLAAYHHATTIFPTPQEVPFLPHLSLLYGDVSVEVKRQLIKEIDRKGEGVFEAKTLHLYGTSGDVSTWREITAFPLQNNGISS